MSKLDELIQQYCPNGVEYKKVGAVCTIDKGVQFNKADMFDFGSYPVINGGILPSGYIEQFNQNENTITISQGGASAGYVNWQAVKFWAGAHCYVVSPKDNVNRRYLYHFVKSKQSELQTCQYGAGIPALSKNTVLGLSIPVPPLAVQEEIVRILDNFSELTAELTARKKQYEYYRDELLTFDDSIQKMKLGDVCRKVNKQNWSDSDRDYEYVDLSSVNRKTHKIIETTKIDKSNAPSRAQQIVFEDDILFGTTRPLLKRTAIVTQEYDGQICSTGYCVLRVDNSIVLPNFVFHLLNLQAFYRYIEKHQVEGNYPSVSDKDVKKYEIPVPPLSEQQRIVNILDRFDALCNDISQGLPAEIEARQKQYEYYRDKLLSFSDSGVAIRKHCGS